MNVLGQAATVAQLAGVDAGSLVSMIVQAVQTVQRNKEECRQLMHHVLIIGDLLPLLQQSEMMQRPEITVLLNGLVCTLREAYMLVTSCQQSNIMYRFFMAANQAQKFRDVRDRIDSYLRIYPLISHIDTRYFLSRLHGPVRPSGTLEPLASDEVVGSFRSVPNPNFRSERFLRARSPVPGCTMADLPLRVVTEIVKTGMAIKKAVETVRQNEKECQDLLVLVDTPIAILSRLQKMGFMTSRPAMCTTALVVLHGSLVHSLKLVTKCQKSTGMDRFLTAMDMSKQLRRVHNDIRRQMHLWSLAITVSMMEITVELTGTTIVRCDGAHPPLPTQPQGPVEMEIYCSHSTTIDARSKEDGADIIAMMTRGLIEFISLSETVATHHVSEDNISGGSDYTSIVTKFSSCPQQKIVFIKVDLSCKRCLNKITKLVARQWQSGLIAVEYDSMKNQVVLVGDVDPLKLQMALRKREGFQARISRFMCLPAPTSTASRPRSSTPLLVELEDTDDAPELVAAAIGSHLVSSAAAPPADYSAQLSQLHHHPALEAPATANDRSFATMTTGPQQQPAAARAALVRHRRHTFNMSRVHRSIRTRHSRTQPLSSVRSGARVLHLLVSCALCTLLVLLAASVWAVR